MRITLVSVAIVTTLLGLSGCTSAPDVATTDLIGKSVALATEQVPSGRSYAWYDLTEQILHREGDLIGGAEPDGEGGVIVAVCADAEAIGRTSSITTGAIPAGDYHGRIKREAEAGAFDALLPECQRQG
ncbi:MULTISPECIES: hypothetical protein [unclassified Curtobacterium]|uniref:hypothetical protein n=1 Tax=unclassified Curtobacterium TaxID=257496 RepID=UPI000F4DF2CF|nr:MULTISPECIES: hypothetical protein [unclassified Curtobacterium]RPE86736.1 hypothetical protein EDF28_0007 [Curtobacterium sp. PhB137]TCL71739.1 hypothetical protein EDF23_11455 [Curtobacterium sp. PhB128]TCL79358.1 hypothetical protein EDF31_11545 [Curtobacterium sp. PhB142]TCL90231.1 hypothetical protein EDF29_1147 [Curtobacterium sp. PhB138]TCL99556.1 hypothetical protein EDF26_1167 [Curtobacterium sp. PhB134]